MTDIELVELESRRAVFVRIEKVAAVLALKDEGPTRVLFDAGGYVDVCGSAKIISLELQVKKLEATVDC